MYSIQKNEPLRYVCETQEEFDYLKAKLTKIRTILLERKDKNMFARLSSFNKRDKDKFISEIHTMWNTLSNAEIDTEFNAICCDKLFYQGTDVSNYPVREMNFPDHSIIYNPEPLEDGEESKTELVA